MRAAVALVGTLSPAVSDVSMKDSGGGGGVRKEESTMVGTAAVVSASISIQATSCRTLVVFSIFVVLGEKGEGPAVSFVLVSWSSTAPDTAAAAEEEERRRGRGETTCAGGATSNEEWVDEEDEWEEEEE